MSAVWFTSDLHIGHKRVAQIRAQSRPRGHELIWTAVARTEEQWLEEYVAWHDEHLAENWDAMVGKDDIVWVLGDISVGGNRNETNALQWISERPGAKRLISGNHDSVHPSNKNAHRMIKDYYEVFDFVESRGVRKVNLPDGSYQEVLLCHYPYEGDSGPIDRDPQWRPRDLGLPILHGHTHSREKMTASSHNEPLTGCRDGVPLEGTDAPYAPAKQIHVGLDAWDLKPVALEQIAELLA